jgi:dTDP-4-dehydrorhamnose 3,5-epimerase
MMIQGVTIKELTTFDDERGFFREIIRHTDDFFSDGFGQLSHSLVNGGVVKAWHGHNFQTQWNYVATGLIKVALYDNRETSETYGELMEFLCGESQLAQVYMFPSGVLHGYKCLTASMNIIYVTSGTYDLDDEIRVPQESEHINYNWDVITG